jgi:hypothetical protein
MGFSPAYATFVVVNALSKDLSYHILPNTRYIYLAVYIIIILALLRRKLTLLEAGFMAYFFMVYLNNTFRFWYPLWIIPFATLNLNSRTFWRTFLFSLAVEFSILSYYILWRWYLYQWDWDYFKVMTPFNVAWSFTLPFLADLIGRIKDRRKFLNEFWI